MSQTENTAQLTKRRKFSLFWALIFVWTLIGPVIYFLWFATRKKEMGAYVEVDRQGNVQVTTS